MKAMSKAVLGEVRGDPRKEIRERYDALRRRMREESPNIADEQAHLDRGTREQAYWQYGYAVALRDVLNLLSRTSRLN